MSSTIWTQCAGSSEIRPLSLMAWRAVEAQHRNATRKLVDSLEEQAVLEAILESHKPPAPSGPVLHYLLFTPFRYPPLRHGSRFGTRHERGIWYGALGIAAVFAEVAYYRLVFLHGTDADLGVLELQLTVFEAKITADFGVDLRRTPFSVYRSEIASPTEYSRSQTLGREMREAGVQAFVYPSARDPRQGTCVAVFDPGAFALDRTVRNQTWDCFATLSEVEFRRRDYSTTEEYRYVLENFLVDGHLPHPAV